MNTMGKSAEVFELQKEYKNRLDLAALDDLSLYEKTVEGLRKSYDVRDSPYHDAHNQVDILREEWERRRKPKLFDQAFRQL